MQQSKDGPERAVPVLLGEDLPDPTTRQIFDAILAWPQTDVDGFRLSLWSSFYTTPVFSKIEDRYGLLRDENNILFCLSAYGPLTAKKIRDVMGRPKNTISRAAERLLKRDMIEVAKVDVDRRFNVMSIKPEGRALVEATTALFRERESLMLRNLSTVERVALDSILSKIMADAEGWAVLE